MNFEIDDDQRLMRESFARVLNDLSTGERVRAAQQSGFDRELWAGLAELGAFAMRVTEEDGGLGLGTFDAVLLMEEAGRTLATGPLAETLMAARLIGALGGESQAETLGAVIDGSRVATLAFHDLARQPRQWLAGGATADLVVARKGDHVVLVTLFADDRKTEPTLADDGIAQIDLSGAPQTVLASGGTALDAFAAAIEEWKLLKAAMLGGLAREALQLGAAYACERHAFGVPIGTFQGLSHPLADLVCEVEGGKLMVWKVIHQIAHGEKNAAAHVSLALWWAATTASRACVQATRTFGGYGLSTESDIHLYNLRAKSWGGIGGDPVQHLEQAGRRLFAGEAAVLPEVGAVSIDFDLGDEARALAQEAEAFFARTLTPALREKAHHSWDGHVPEVHKKLAEADLLFPEWPKERGGRGATPYAVYAARQAWVDNGWTSYPIGVGLMVATIIDRFGAEQARKDILEPLMRGDIICALGYSEPGSGSDVFAVKTRATRDGDGWRIDGTKMFTSGANIADYVLMLCRTNPDVPKHKGLTMFMVPLNAPGVEVQPVHTFMEDRTNITFYDAVRIPDAYRLGEVDGGLKTMSAALELEQMSTSARAIWALAEAAEQLCRTIERDGRPLIENSGAQTRIARTVADALASEMLGMRALWAIQNKLTLPAAGPMSKMFSSERLLRDGNDLVDLTAPESLAHRGGPAETVNMAYRFAHGATIWAGTSEVHRSMIAERLLGLPRSRN
jgi:alkylation response protein AidB-like acyl-CoA dehydrogenase